MMKYLQLGVGYVNSFLLWYFLLFDCKQACVKCIRLVIQDLSSE